MHVHAITSSVPDTGYNQPNLFDLNGLPVSADRRSTDESPQLDFTTRIQHCIHCTATHPASVFRGRLHCPKCLAVHRRALHKKYRNNRERMLLNNTAYRFGMTTEAYQAMIDAQNGVCAICALPEASKSKYGRQKSLCVDHNHQTGKIRALLCSRCNALVAHFENNSQKIIQAAKNYLASHLD